MALTRTEIIEAVAEKVGVQKKHAAKLVDAFFETFEECLKEKGRIKIQSFGIFEIRSKKERPGRNPFTGQTLTIPARKILTFAPSKVLRRGINRSSRFRDRQISSTPLQVGQ